MLPPTLIEYTLSRALSRHPYLRRNLTNAALNFRPPDYSTEFAITRNQPKSTDIKPRDTSKPPNSISADLAQRVRALEKVTDEKDAEFGPLFFSEQDLLSFYENILAHPETAHIENISPPLQIDTEVQHRQDLILTESVEQRLRSSMVQPSKLTLALRQGLGDVHAETSQSGATPVHQRVVNQVQLILNQLDEVGEQGPTPLSLAILSTEEWDAVLRCSLHTRDTETALHMIELMKRNNLDIPENYINDTLQLYVQDANPIGFETALAKLVQGPPTPQQRHLHIKAQLNSTPLHAIPTTALSVLHTYESHPSHGHLPPPQKTYSSVIRALFSTRDPSGGAVAQARAQAWDLFAHMRYVSHPDPDALLYTQMIRACASPYTSPLSSASSASRSSSDPERALDLWTEMTIEKGLQPSRQTWNAIILACAKSGRKMYVHEAFRLSKEMLDSNRDAFGNSMYGPDERTFCALLEAAKRIEAGMGLGRARWIFAEMVRNRERDLNGAGVKVNEEALMHVFHAYAAYRPPFRRGLARIVEGEEEEGKEADPAPLIDAKRTPAPAPTPAPAFTHVPPQTSVEVINEVDILFHRLLLETGIRREDDGGLDSSIFEEIGKFSGVKITTRLINSYLSVHYRHGSIQAAKELFGRVFEEVGERGAEVGVIGSESNTGTGTGVMRDARTYVEALERCAIAKKGKAKSVNGEGERELALVWAEEIMEKFKELEEGERGGHQISPRLIERTHAAFIRVLTLTNNVDRALSHLEYFVQRYPASAIRDSGNIVKLPMRSSRTSLVAGDRPLVRLTTQAEMPDWSVPPLMMWRDLEVLHHRLVASGRERDIAYVKYVCKSYEWALRVRRDETMRAKPRAEVGLGLAGESPEVES
ncbi:hypothetical protein D9757_007554 [Collybiopsis confluens]|uniref:Uncharacterized protein n=1 Tax=Collybiopsis confluens TaxID=2823264 RepID=A0A8H5HEP9_9AGAR|nr:hypothetical protein D9757_007554 [Collybiopsis confluens]